MRTPSINNSPYLRRKQSEEAPKAIILTTSEVFWGLGNDWWKQIIDARFCHGPMVFDKGLHGHDMEPGFYRSARNASRFAHKHLMLWPTVPLYLQLHRVACAHFKGKSNDTNMTAKDTGVFWRADSCEGVLRELYALTPEKMIDVPKEIQFLCCDKRGFPYNQKIQERAWRRIGEFSRETGARIKRVNSYIAKRSKKLGASAPIATLKQNDRGDKVLVTYHVDNRESQAIITRLFDQFKEGVHAATSSDEKIRRIADLYQVLEWLHPFRDGQGRTDLTLLAKELAANGFTPAILRWPYFSTYHHLDDWVIYLKQGMERWQEEFWIRHLSTPPKSLGQSGRQP